MGCVQNPVVGREAVWGGPLPKASVARRVVVVGGGPAGLECARVAALRGQRVMLIERDEVPGGQVHLAARAPQRGELARMVDWLWREAGRLGAELRFGREATPEGVLDERPDVVVIATGAKPGRLAPGLAEGVPVFDAWSVLAGRAEVGRRVLVIDETGTREAFGVAGHLAAAGREVELVTPTIYPGQNIERSGWRTSYQQLLEQGVRFHALSELVRADASTVAIRHVYTGAETSLPKVATVVTALAPLARDTLYRALKGRAGRVELIGDARAPRGIEHAVYEGHAPARALE
jgi:hypothetical protein